MQFYFPHKILKGKVNLPASKSISNRVLVLNALANNKLCLKNLSASNDTQVLFDALFSDKTQINIGDSGTAMRFLTAFFAQSTGERILTGSERMKQRPVGVLVGALRQLGAQIEHIENEGFPPLKIVGRQLAGGEIALTGEISSQFVSALMLVAPKMGNGLTIHLQGETVSQPYIEMTAAVMRHCGISVFYSNNQIKILPQKFVGQPLEIENDWTAASYWYEMLAVAGIGQIFLPNLKKESMQGDSVVAQIFEHLGVQTVFKENGSEIFATAQNVDFLNFNCINTPDLAQTLAVACVLKHIPFCLSGLQTLKIKETDRIAALLAECRKIGSELQYSESENTLWWNGKTTEIQHPVSIRTYGDHRMAMAFAACALRFAVEIEKPEITSKSYPNFWEELERF